MAKQKAFVVDAVGNGLDKLNEHLAKGAEVKQTHPYLGGLFVVTAELESHPPPSPLQTYESPMAGGL